MLIGKRYPVADQCPGLRTSEEGEAGCVQGYLTYTVYRLHSAQHTAHQLSVINTIILLCCFCVVALLQVSAEQDDTKVESNLSC